MKAVAQTQTVTTETTSHSERKALIGRQSAPVSWPIVEENNMIAIQ